MNYNRKYFKRSDLLLIGILCVLALLVFAAVRLSSDKGTTAQIYLQDICVRTCDLGKDSVFHLDQAPEVTFQIENGKIRFLSSDCPDQICVRTGYISLAGQTAACLPHRLVIRIVSETSSDLDVIL